MNTQTVKRWAVVLLLTVAMLLAGCRNRARLATEVDTTDPGAPIVATIEPIPPTPPAQIDTTGDVSSAGADLGPFVEWYALISVLLLFVAIAGGAVYVFASCIGAAFIRRNSQLFTRR